MLCFSDDIAPEVREQIERQHALEEARKRDLMWALRSRLLTKDEMQEVDKHGKYLNVFSGDIYSDEEKRQELNEALLQQFKFRRLADER